MTASKPLLNVRNLSIDFISENNTTTALKNISFSVNKGEIVALVGESGSGKSVTALSILQLIPSPPVVYKEGQIIFSENNEAPVDILKAGPKEIQTLRGNKIAMIFQEPMTSLNPVLTCGNQVMESILLHKKISAGEAKQETITWFEKVKLPDPAGMFHRYPHQLSGGQKQRVMIAIAMCCHPLLLICDEPTTALDVTVQKTILQLIKELQQQQDMGVLFITHDLGVVAEIADRAIVLYKGEIAEENKVEEQPLQSQEERDENALEQSKRTYAKLDLHGHNITGKIKRSLYSSPAQLSAASSDAFLQKMPELQYSHRAAVNDSRNDQNADRYLMFKDSEGRFIRISKKLTSLFCCVSGEEQDDNCTDQLKKWREKIASSSFIPSPDNFMDILDLVSSLQDTRN
ncbi:MAG: ABC transporter ATP-binding protein [Bacteroidota bacterium]